MSPGGLDEFDFDALNALMNPDQYADTAAYRPANGNAMQSNNPAGQWDASTPASGSGSSTSLQPNNRSADWGFPVSTEQWDFPDPTGQWDSPAPTSASDASTYFPYEPLQQQARGSSASLDLNASMGGTIQQSPAGHPDPSQQEAYGSTERPLSMLSGTVQQNSAGVDFYQQQYLDPSSIIRPDPDDRPQAISPLVAAEFFRNTLSAGQFEFPQTSHVSRQSSGANHQLDGHTTPNVQPNSPYALISSDSGSAHPDVTSQSPASSGSAQRLYANNGTALFSPQNALLQSHFAPEVSRKRSRDSVGSFPNDSLRRQRSFLNAPLPIHTLDRQNSVHAGPSLGTSLLVQGLGGAVSGSSYEDPFDLTADDEAEGLDPFYELNQAYRGLPSGTTHNSTSRNMVSEASLANMIMNAPTPMQQHSGQQSISSFPTSYPGLTQPALSGEAPTLPDFHSGRATVSQPSPVNQEEAQDQEVSALIDSINAETDVPPDQRERTPPQMLSQLMEHQKLALGWLKKQETSPTRGGILADDMGLGKTVEAIALMLAMPPRDPIRKTTLIVAPLSLMKQWEVEINRHIRPEHHLKVFVYHGNIKNVDFGKLRTYDVVLTTYQTLSSELKRTDRLRTLLAETTRWHRIILDEAHAIRTRNTDISKAVHELKADYRLCMTGTPMMNSIGELFPYLRFLRTTRYREWSEFNLAIFKPVNSRSRAHKEQAIKLVQTILKQIMLRRQKFTLIDGRPICVIPPKHEHIHDVKLSPDEVAFYKDIEARGQAYLKKFLAQDNENTSSGKYSAVLLFLLRLRQACCHGRLITHLSSDDVAADKKDKLVENAKTIQPDIIRRLKEQFSAECPICFDVTLNATIFLPCGHACCGECTSKLFDDTLRHQQKCPQCRDELDRDRMTDFEHFCRLHCPEMWEEVTGVGLPVIEEIDNDDSSDDSDSLDYSYVDDSGNLAGFVVPDSEDETQRDSNRCRDRARQKPKPTLAELRKGSLRSKEAKQRYLRRLRKGFVNSTKLSKALEIINDTRDKDATEKIIVFSQFTSLLDLMEVPLQQGGYKYQRYDGGMKMNERSEAIAQFMHSPDVNILLLSLKAGNSGLNLTKASQVIFLDPFWNPYVEDQAVDRAHRMMQEREVHVHRLLVPMTVEDRIIELQQRKRETIGAALEGGKSPVGTGLNRQELRYLFFGGPNNGMPAPNPWSHR